MEGLGCVQQDNANMKLACMAGMLLLGGRCALSGSWQCGALLVWSQMLHLNVLAGVRR